MAIFLQSQVQVKLETNWGKLTARDTVNGWFSFLRLLPCRIYKKKRMNWTRRRWMRRTPWKRRRESPGVRMRSCWARRPGYWRWSTRSRLWSTSWRRGRRREKIHSNSRWTWSGRRADSRVSGHCLFNFNLANIATKSSNHLYEAGP